MGGPPRRSRIGSASRQVDRSNQPPTAADRYDAEVTARDHDVTATWIFGGAAIVTGGIALAFYYLDNPEMPERMFVPTLGADSAGVSWLGRF